MPVAPQDQGSLPAPSRAPSAKIHRSRNRSAEYYALFPHSFHEKWLRIMCEARGEVTRNLRESLPYHGQVGVGVRAIAVAAVVLALVTPARTDHGSFQQPARPPDIHYTPTRHAVADAMLLLA